MSLNGAALRAAVPVFNARAAASRRNGAKSRGPKTAEGKARSSRNALKHGLRAQKHVVLPQEDAAEFAALEKALIAELAPVGVLQIVLAQRIVVAAWRLARADRLEAEVFEEMGYDGVDSGLTLIRDGNGTRSIDTLMRYRGAALAEFMRSLRTLQALQAQRQPTAAAHATLPAPPPQPNEPRKMRKDRGLASSPASPGPSPDRAATGRPAAVPETAVTRSLCGVPQLPSCAIPGRGPAGVSVIARGPHPAGTCGHNGAAVVGSDWRGEAPGRDGPP
jgi:hypothetical protein